MKLFIFLLLTLPLLAIPVAVWWDSRSLPRWTGERVRSREYRKGGKWVTVRRVVVLR